jgi:hypothetical protein
MQQAASDHSAGWPPPAHTVSHRWVDARSSSRAACSRALALQSGLQKRPPDARNRRRSERDQARGRRARRARRPRPFYGDVSHPPTLGMVRVVPVCLCCSVVWTSRLASWSRRKPLPPERIAFQRRMGRRAQTGCASRESDDETAGTVRTPTTARQRNELGTSW